MTRLTSPATPPARRPWDRVFTPQAEDGRARFCFSQDSLVMAAGSDLSRKGPGIHAVLLFGGWPFAVAGIPCGGACYCDAVLIPLADMRAAVPDETAVRRLALTAGSPAAGSAGGAL